MNGRIETHCPPIAPANRTRRSRSIAWKLVRQGKIHWLPIYWILQLSDLAREGIKNSGSFRFADHIYRAQPAGIGPIGRWLDARLLRSPASLALRERYLRAKSELRAALKAQERSDSPLQILTVPCGLPRDIVEVAAALRKEDPALLARVRYTGMDIDPAVLRAAEAFTRNSDLPSRSFWRGNAIDAREFPREQFHAISSTGLGEFLDDSQLESFYRNVHAALLPGGVFYTSATDTDAWSERLLSTFELITHYRSPDQVAAILRRMSWSKLTVSPHASGLQTFVTAVR